MPLRPPIQTSAKPLTGSRESLIRSLAIKNRLDPAAVLSVAAGEGGFVNRSGDVGDLAGGGSYGPFQLYAKGALPAQYRGRPESADQWAWSPAGIQYALGKMVSSGAAGLRGNNAINTIIRKFERPYDPDSSVAKALGRYGGYNSGGSAQEGSSLPPSAAPGVSQAPLTPAYRQSTPNPAIRNTGIRDALVQGLIAGQDIYDILPTLPSLRASEPAQNVTPLTTRLAGSKPLRTAPGPSQGRPVPLKGEPKGDWRKWVGKIETRQGPSAPHKPQTLQFVSKVAQLFGKPLTPTGNESHSLTTTSGNVSQHSTGDAADIPASGSELVSMGQAALIAAGADPVWARKQQGGLFNINGKQVIFATNQGGNHFDHVHVGM